MLPSSPSPCTRLTTSDGHVAARGDVTSWPPGLRARAIYPSPCRHSPWLTRGSSSSPVPKPHGFPLPHRRRRPILRYFPNTLPSVQAHTSPRRARARLLVLCHPQAFSDHFPARPVTWTSQSRTLQPQMAALHHTAAMDPGITPAVPWGSDHLSMPFQPNPQALHHEQPSDPGHQEHAPLQLPAGLGHTCSEVKPA